MKGFPDVADVPVLMTGKRCVLTASKVIGGGDYKMGNSMGTPNHAGKPYRVPLVWPGPFAAALWVCTRFLSCRPAVPCRARLGALSAAPWVCTRPPLCRLATPCRTHACLYLCHSPPRRQTHPKPRHASHVFTAHTPHHRHPAVGNGETRHRRGTAQHQPHPGASDPARPRTH